jgi:hypothetical protein
VIGTSNARSAPDSPVAHTGVDGGYRAHPDDYDPAFEDKFVERVDKLDPPSPA